jgi:hypothetical protein
MVDSSRSTIDRAVRELVDECLIDHRDGRWHATPLGRSAYDAYTQYRRDLDRMAAIEPLVDVLPSGAICDELVAGAQAYPTDAAVPDAVAGQVIDRLNRGNCVSLTTPFFGAGFLRRVRQCHDDDTRITLIVADEAIHRLIDAHQDVIRSICEDQAVDLRQATVPFEYGLWVVPDDHAGVMMLGDHGVAGLLVNDSPDAISWASDRLDSVSEQAVRVEPHQ